MLNYFKNLYFLFSHIYVVEQVKGWIKKKLKNPCLGSNLSINLWLDFKLLGCASWGNYAGVWNSCYLVIG